MNKLKEGISLRKIHNWLIVIAVIVSAFMIYSTYRLTNNFMHVRDALNENIALENAIDSLMEASDYLTENAQRFTVHGDRRFMDQYFKEALNSKRREQAIDEMQLDPKAYNNLYAVYRKSIANLNFKASHDELTGAYNRAGYDLLVSSLDMKSTYLLFFDLDNFKVINDTYGHEIGDKVLQKLVQVLKGSFRSDDYICRLGGDEFVVFMVHADEMQHHLVERKMVNINRELQTPGDGIPAFTASVGIVHGAQAADAEALLKKGDEAMYQSKKQGKHTFTFYTA